MVSNKDNGHCGLSSVMMMPWIRAGNLSRQPVDRRVKLEPLFRVQVYQRDALRWLVGEAFRRMLPSFRECLRSSRSASVAHGGFIFYLVHFWSFRILRNMKNSTIPKTDKSRLLHSSFCWICSTRLSILFSSYMFCATLEFRLFELVSESLALSTRFICCRWICWWIRELARSMLQFFFFVCDVEQRAVLDLLSFLIEQ